MNQAKPGEFVSVSTKQLAVHSHQGLKSSVLVQGSNIMIQKPDLDFYTLSGGKIDQMLFKIKDLNSLTDWLFNNTFQVWDRNQSQKNLTHSSSKGLYILCDGKLLNDDNLIFEDNIDNIFKSITDLSYKDYIYAKNRFKEFQIIGQTNATTIRKRSKQLKKTFKL